MRKSPAPICAALAVFAASCASEPAEQQRAEERTEIPEPSGPPVVQQAERDGAGAATTQPGLSWAGAASGEGMTLRLTNPDGSLRMSMACLGNPGRLVATVPSFSPIGSEDRFALALGEEPATLVADPTRQQAGAGVTGEGAIPDNFAALLQAADSIGALYGTQQVGPHIAPPEDLANALIRYCSELRQ